MNKCFLLSVLVSVGLSLALPPAQAQPAPDEPPAKPAPDGPAAEEQPPAPDEPAQDEQQPAPEQPAQDEQEPAPEQPARDEQQPAPAQQEQAPDEPTPIEPPPEDADAEAPSQAQPPGTGADTQDAPAEASQDEPPAASPATEPPNEPAVRDEPPPADASETPAAPAEGEQPPAFEIVEVEVVDPAAAGASVEAEARPGTDDEVVTEDDAIAPIEVSVAGVRVARTAGSAHVLDSEQLERFEYDDPHAALLQVPGVYIRTEDGFGLRPNISLRGADPERSKKVTLMEDGVLFGPAPYSAPAAYYFPLTTRMMALRVVKGPSTVAYGPQTVGGGIDYVTRPIPATTEATLDLGVGQYGYRKAHGTFGASTEQVGFLVEGVRLHSDGFKELDGGGDTGFTRNEWMLKASYVVDPTARILHSFQLKAGYSDEASNETYLGLTDADFRDTPNRRYPASQLDRMENHRTQLVGSYLLEVPERGLDLKTTYYRHDFTRSWDKLNSFEGTRVDEVVANPEQYQDYYAVLTGEADSATGLDTLLIGPNARDFVSQGGQSVLSGSAVTGPVAHRYEAGVRVHNDSIERRHSQSGYLMDDGELYPDGGPEQVTVANRDSSIALAVHAIDTVTWKDLSITGGVRMEVIWSERHDKLADETSRATTAVGLPGLGVFYQLVDGFGVLAGVYRGFSPPQPGDDAAEPEDSVNYEMGARYDKGRARAEAIGFVNDYSNLTTICTFSAGCDPENVDAQFSAGEVLTYGLELYAEHTPRVGAWGFPMTGAYTWTVSEFRNGFVSPVPAWGDVKKGDRLPYIPNHQLNLTAGVEHEAASLVAGFTYVQGAPEGVGGSPLDRDVFTDDLFALDLGGTIAMGNHLDFYANLRNATNYRGIGGRRPYGARPNAPLWFMAGIKGHL